MTGQRWKWGTHATTDQEVGYMTMPGNHMAERPGRTEGEDKAEMAAATPTRAT
jgi:hypothetical protein